ncbi:hypothetical protein [Lysobacter gummosus]|uniref:hypothetical protein n=1 Tax=Lysobacter gummosus TaxID=262324 RepID=UPI0036413ECB
MRNRPRLSVSTFDIAMQHASAMKTQREMAVPSTLDAGSRRGRDSGPAERPRTPDRRLAGPLPAGLR